MRTEACVGQARDVSDNDDREFNVMLAIFSVSAGMVGVCLTGIGLLQVITSLQKAGSLSDEFLSVDAVLFLACCLLSFLWFRLKHTPLKRRLRQLSDVLFFLGLLLMAVICVLITRAFA